MLLALALLLSVPDWVPMRWATADPQTLTLLESSPVNCLLLEQKHWTPAFVSAAQQRKLTLLGIVRSDGDPVATARRAQQLHLSGVVLEGDFEPALSAKVRDSVAKDDFVAIELPPRSRIRLDSNAPVLGTYQGVWPGVQAQDGPEAKSAPSGAPWIDTNTGFLRFLRASTGATVWIANAPPARTIVTPERYLQALADAEMVGAKWVISLDEDLQQKLWKRDPKALSTWSRIGKQIQFFESRKEWRQLQPYGALAIVQDVDSGALLSGGILDMIAVKHTPVRPISNRKLSAEALKGAQMTVDVDPSSLTPEQTAILKAWTRAGGTLLKGPPGWKFPAPTAESITLGKDDTNKLDQIWKEVNSMTGRRNLGARLFNVSSMLSSLMTTPDEKTMVLHLVNYSDYPVENVAVHLLGKHKKVTLLSPDEPPKVLTPYEVEEGLGVDLDRVGAVAALIVED